MYSGPSGELLLVIAALVSLQLAEGRTADQLELLSAFFEVLGDNLGLLAARREISGSGESTKASPVFSPSGQSSGRSC